MGIPDEPFWAPDDVVAAYRDTPRPGASRLASSGRSGSPSWQGDSGRLGGLLGRHRPQRLASSLPAFEHGRACRRPVQGDGEGAHGVPGDRPRADLRRGGPHRQHRHEGRTARCSRPTSTPEGAAGLLRHPRARHGRGARRHGRPRRHRAGRRHVLRLQRLRPTDVPARCRRAGSRRSSCSATTRSASARTARRTSPSSTSPRSAPSPDLQVIRPADANETDRRLAGPRSRTTGRPCSFSAARASGSSPTDRRSSPRGRVVHDTGVGADRWCSSAPAARSASASTPRRALADRGGRGPGRVAARRGIASRSSRRATATRSCRRACRSLSVEAATTFGWVALRRRLDRHRPLRRQRSG